MMQTKTNTLEQEYSANTELPYRKKFAQFFTPEPIAQIMANWILGNKNLKNVLEPAFGLGIFSRQLLNQKTDIEIKGFEIDSKIFETAKEYFSSFPTVNLCLEDYMYNDWNNKYDGIICNPPYFKFHDYDNKPILKEIENRLDFRFNGFTNLYALFLLKSIYQLAPNGRIAYIIPSEFLNSDYGTLVKDYLLKSNSLRHLFIVDFKENLFDHAMTTASIILLANDSNSKNVNFSNIFHKSDLQSIEKYISDYPRAVGSMSYGKKTLDPNVKWRRYYQKQNALSYKNLVPFSNYAKVVRGIATGANEYFTFNKSKANDHSIPSSQLIPCICKAKDVKGQFFTLKDFEQLEINNELIYLFNAKDSDDKFVLEYINLGKENAVNKKYLTKNRKPWYSLEKRPPSPIWVSVFNRNDLRFIRNEANISNLTIFHCVYPTKSDLFNSISIELLFAYLLTDTATSIFNDNRREYGNGLKKFEPNDLNKAQIVDLIILSNESKEKIIKLFKAYRKRQDEKLINDIDQIIKSEFLNQ